MIAIYIFGSTYNVGVSMTIYLVISGHSGASIDWYRFDIYAIWFDIKFIDEFIIHIIWSPIISSLVHILFILEIMMNDEKFFFFSLNIFHNSHCFYNLYKTYMKTKNKIWHLTYSYSCMLYKLNDFFPSTAICIIYYLYCNI